MRSVLGAPLASSGLKDPRRELLDWAAAAVHEAFSQARMEGRPLLRLQSTHPEWKAPPLAVLDSLLEDVHLFGDRDRLSLGLGRATEYESASPASLSKKSARKALGLHGSSPSDASQVLIMGGWPFSPSGRGGRRDPWFDLPRSRWVVPALTLVSECGKTQLTLTVLADPRSDDEGRLTAYYGRLVKALLAAEQVEREGGANPASPALTSTTAIPSERSWISAAEQALESISGNQVRKVVLSRSVRLVFDGELQPSAIARKLLTFNPDCTVFAVKRRNSVFLGATPEALLTAKDGLIEIDCLAATAPRGRNDAEDGSIGAELLADGKSREEHKIVVQAAVRSISPFSSQIEVAQSPTLKKLATIQHLYTPVKARLLPDQDIWSVALSLWPNPAIAGEPKERAIRWIQDFEPFNRGWFAGVVGCLRGDFQDGRLVIGIRSGLVRKNEAVIYAGAGLVAGSDPGKELEETGWKLETMRRSLPQKASDLPRRRRLAQHGNV